MIGRQDVVPFDFGFCGNSMALSLFLKVILIKIIHSNTVRRDNTRVGMFMQTYLRYDIPMMTSWLEKVMLSSRVVRLHEVLDEFVHSPSFGVAEAKRFVCTP